MSMNSSIKNMQVVMKKTSEIIPYEHNPRNNDHTAKQLKKSIKAFGFKNPIILDKNDVIVSGHARLKAALMLAMDEVPCIYAEGLTDEEIKAFRIADNKTAEIAGWDYDKLFEEMSTLNNDGFSLDFTGFNEAEQLAYTVDIAPEKIDRNEYKAYAEAADNEILKSSNIILFCHSEAEKEYLRTLFKEQRDLKRLYRAAELIEHLASAD